MFKTYSDLIARKEETGKSESEVLKELQQSDFVLLSELKVFFPEIGKKIAKRLKSINNEINFLSAEIVPLEVYHNILKIREECKKIMISEEKSILKIISTLPEKAERLLKEYNKFRRKVVNKHHNLIKYYKQKYDQLKHKLQQLEQKIQQLERELENIKNEHTDLDTNLKTSQEISKLLKKIASIKENNTEGIVKNYRYINEVMEVIRSYYISILPINEEETN